MKAGSTKNRTADAPGDLHRASCEIKRKEKEHEDLRRSFGRFVAGKACTLHSEATREMWIGAATEVEAEQFASLLGGLFDFAEDLGFRATARGVVTAGSGAPLLADGLRVFTSAPEALVAAVAHHRQRADVLSGEVEALAEKNTGLRIAHATVADALSMARAKIRQLESALHREAESARGAR